MVKKSSAPGGNDPDGKTVILNSNGEYEAPDKENIGDFENSSLNSWSGNGLTNTSGIGGADNTNTFVRYGTSSNGTHSIISRSIDLTDVKEITFHLAVDPANVGTGDSSDAVEFLVGGTVQGSISGGSQTNWQEFTYDASGDSGSTTLKARINVSSGTTFDAGADEIFIEYDATRLNR